MCLRVSASLLPASGPGQCASISLPLLSACCARLSISFLLLSLPTASCPAAGVSIPARPGLSASVPTCISTPVCVSASFFASTCLPPSSPSSCVSVSVSLYLYSSLTQGVPLSLALPLQPAISLRPVSRIQLGLPFPPSLRIPHLLSLPSLDPGLPAAPPCPPRLLSLSRSLPPPPGQRPAPHPRLPGDPRPVKAAPGGGGGGRGAPGGGADPAQAPAGVSEDGGPDPPGPGRRARRRGASPAPP